MSLTGLSFVLIYFFCIFRAIKDKPIFGLYAYLLAFYAHPPAQWWGKTLPDLRWAFLAGIVTLLSVHYHVKKDKVRFFSVFENKIFFVFALYVVLQYFWALSPNIHEEYMVLVIKFLLLIFIMQNAIQNEQDLKGFIWVNLLGVCYYAYIGMFVQTSGRLEGVGTPGMESANQLGQHMAVVLVFSAYLLFSNIGKKRILYILLLAVAFNGVLLTESRGVLVGIILSGAVSIFLVPRNKLGQFFRYALLAGLGASVLVGPQIIERFQSMVGENDQQDKSAESRMVIINAQVDMFLDSPLLGYGHRGTLLLSPQYLPREYLTSTDGLGERRASHNFLFALLVDHGLIGTALYLLVIFSCWRKVRYIHKTSKFHNDSAVQVSVLIGLGLALVCLMVAGMGSNNKKLEIDIWLYALIPLVYGWIIKARSLNNAEQINGQDQASTEMNRSGESGVNRWK